jgi:N-acetylmuramoyl-L-alanine amidase
MSIGIKNGEHHTSDIYMAKLIFLFIIIISVSASGTDIKNDKSWVIVIDPGHGGRDPGAPGSFSFEKNITLAIALKTGEYIEKNIPNVKVVYTRKDDSSVDLYERPKIANKLNADLFISIHANWAKEKSVQGTETYIMGITKDKQNLEVAMKENEVIYLEKDYTTRYEGFDPKSLESYIMFTVTQNIFQQQSTGLASKIEKEYKENNKRIDRGVKQAGFLVLYMTSMPSILTETGFMTSPTEERYLNSKEGQENIASSIFRACRDYINEIDSKSGISAVKQQIPDQQALSSIPVIPPKEEVEYTIQVLTSSVKIEIKPENFKGLNDIAEINMSDRYRYVSGRFSRYNEAVIYRKKLRDIYPDAFVVAVKGNKILPLQQALEQDKNK